MTVDGTVNGEVFHSYVLHFLVPKLFKSDIVILDNFGVHKQKEARKAIEDKGAEVIFLPPYSPDLNPIEMMWSILKAIIRVCT